MKYILRVVYERFYEVQEKTLRSAKEEVVQKTIEHICSLSEGKTHNVFTVTEFDPRAILECPTRRQGDVTLVRVH